MKYSKLNKRYHGRISSPKTPIKATIGGILALVLLAVVLLRTHETHMFLSSSSTLSSITSLFISKETNAMEHQPSSSWISRHLLNCPDIDNSTNTEDVEVSLYNLFKYLIFNQNFTKNR